MPLKAGTRGSRLAMVQTDRVCGMLTERGIETEVTEIKTVGDARTQVPMHQVGGQGIFVRALDDAILAGEIDFAVHSMKDIPAYRPEGLCTVAVLKRDSPADFLVHECDIAAWMLKYVNSAAMWTPACGNCMRGSMTRSSLQRRGCSV